MSRLVPELRERGYVDGEPVPNMERPLRVLAAESPHSTFLKVSEGCDHRCAFCAIPHMRGLHRSADPDRLVAEAKALGEQGVRELNLVSQDTTWYGRDLRRRNPAAPLLPDLLNALLCGTDVDWFRLFYMYPSGITREMAELIAREPRLLPYLDMPLQHGSDRVLARMRRPGAAGVHPPAGGLAARPHRRSDAANDRHRRLSRRDRRRFSRDALFS